MKINLVVVLATLNALLVQVSGSLPEIRQAAENLLQKQGRQEIGDKAIAPAKTGS